MLLQAQHSSIHFFLEKGKKFLQYEFPGAARFNCYVSSLLNSCLLQTLCVEKPPLFFMTVLQRRMVMQLSTFASTRTQQFSAGCNCGTVVKALRQREDKFKQQSMQYKNPRNSCNSGAVLPSPESWKAITFKLLCHLFSVGTF